MAKYVEVASAYDHVEVMQVKQNVDVKKAVGNGSYKGTTLLVQPKDGSDPKTVKIAQNWLDIEYPTQQALKAKIAGLKVGDQITVVRNKTVKDMEKEEYDALDKEARKVTGNWGVKEILDGYVIPEGHERPAARTGGTSGQTFGGKRDTTGIETGHALNGAMRFLGGKASVEDYVATAKEVHNITAELKAEYAAANPGMSDYDSGAAVGNAVLNALEIAAARKKGLDVVPGIARKWLAEAVPAIVAHIKPPKVEEKAPEPVKEEEPVVDEAQAADEEDDDSFDDIPFN